MAAAKFNEIAPGQAALKQKQGSLQFIAGPDASQVSSPTQLFDVQVDCDADPWAGLDLIWTNLPTTIPALLGRELADGRLGIRSDAQFGRSLVATRTVKDGEVICLCHGMRFTDIHKVQDFLQQKGNSRFADRIVRVGNVAKDGEKVDVHVVLMGAAGYINHYLGIRRFPNSVIEMDCASGPTSGFLKIVCQTATGQGIAGGGPIVLNYGPHYDLTQKPHEEEAPFLGGLDSFFQKLDAGMTKNEPEQVTPQKRQGEPESSRTPPNPDAKKAKTEAKAEATVQETPKKEATVQVEKPKAESSGAPAGSSPPLVELGECNGLKVGLQVSENGPSTLHVFNTDTKNKRMSKGTVFCKWTDGNVVRGVELPANGVEYALQPSSWVLHESLQYIQVQDAIKKEPACSCLFGYEPFPCATPPKVLKPAKAGKMIVVCKDAQTVQVHRAPSDALRLVFIMKMQKETMLPHGLALVCSKQITVPAGQWKQV